LNIGGNKLPPKTHNYQIGNRVISFPLFKPKNSSIFTLMGKRILTILIICLFAVTSYTQGQTTEIPALKIGYISSVELLESIPEKTRASRAINELNQKYKEELSIMQNDYNKKYSDFIAEQTNMAESIKLRRMQELHELEKNISDFMKIAQEDIETQEKMLLEPIVEKLKTAITEVGIANGFTCIYDVSNPGIAFVTPLAIDANPLVKRKFTEIK